MISETGFKKTDTFWKKKKNKPNLQELMNF